PTPAVAGTPRDTALGEIAATEDTPRRCYAGYLLHSDATGRTRAYVNLRCAQVSPDGYCIYAGGGITANSDPAAEWAETEAKAAVLLDILNRNSLRK
ncbi:MAG: chorismate-binding protein, partial [Muribaculaceae bacterium]|nr:chorismate-binding protein [Muribaculaceae bacterium]